MTESTATPTLTDFLLARIAEDVAYVRDGGLWLEGWPYSRTRVLAECEARRQIVESWDFVDPNGAGRSTLESLALPYADHPDYREEWKPCMTSILD